MFENVIILNDKILDEYREKAELPIITEDTLEVSRQMRASSPPPTAAGNDDNLPKRTRPFRRVRNIVISEVVSFNSILLSIITISHLILIYIFTIFLLKKIHYGSITLLN